MAKGKSVRLNEDAIKMAMESKDQSVEPSSQGAQPIQIPVAEYVDESEQDILPEQKSEPQNSRLQVKEPSVRQTPRRRREVTDYRNVFLARKPGVDRKQTYVSVHVLDKLNHFLPVIAKGFTVTAYIDNVLTNHLEQYQDEINELYINCFSKPFNHEKE